MSAFVVFASCKKEELQPNIDDTPEFFVNGEIDGKELKLVAGDNDYYMFSSHSTNDNDVQQFIGELKTENCERGCPESLEIIYTNEQGPAEQIASEPLLKTGFKSFTNPNAGNEIEVSFNPEESYTSKAVKVEYTWEFGDGTISHEKNPKHVFSGKEEFYEVNLKVKTSKGCESEIKNRVYTESKAETDFVITQTQQSLAFKPEVKEVTPQNYLWEFESGNTASTPYVDYQSDPKKGIEQVCLTVTDENGNKSQRCKNLILKQEYAFCAANYAYKSGKREDPNGDLQLGTVYLKYTDATGTVFYSKPTNKDEFELTSIEDYDLNENGEPTKKISFTANTQLISAEGEKISVSNLTGSVAIAYPGK